MRFFQISGNPGTGEENQENACSRGTAAGEGIKPFSFREYVWSEYLPYALSIGVPYDAFWSLNPRRIEQAFGKAYKLHLEDQQEIINFTAWVQGAYISRALAAIFGKTKYPKKPVPLNADTQQSGINNMKAKVEAFAISFNARFAARSVMAGKEINENGNND